MRNLQYVRALGYLNLGPKTIKNGSNILPKLACKTMFQVGSILDPTWLHFGRVLAPKLEPNWHQNALELGPTTHPKKNRIFNRLRTDFGWILASNLEILGGPKFLLFGSWNHLGANLAPKTPKTLPDRRPSKTPKTPPQRVPKTP